MEVVLSPSCVELLDGSDALVEGRNQADEFFRLRRGVGSSVVFVATRADGKQVGEDRADAILLPLSKTLPKPSVLILVLSFEFWSPASVLGIFCFIFLLVPSGVEFLIFFVPAYFSVLFIPVVAGVALSNTPVLEGRWGSFRILILFVQGMPWGAFRVVFFSVLTFLGVVL